MTQIEHDKIINLMKHGALQGVDTCRLDGKCEDVIPIEDAIAIVDLVKAESDDKIDVVVSLDVTDETRIPRLDADDVFEIIDEYRADRR